MIIESVRQSVCEKANEDALIFDNPSFDKSIIGISTEGAIVYSLTKMIEELCEEDTMDEEDAWEFICYNTLRTIPYMSTGTKPVVVDDMTLYELE